MFNCPITTLVQLYSKSCTCDRNALSKCNFIAFYSSIGELERDIILITKMTFYTCKGILLLAMNICMLSFNFNIGLYFSFLIMCPIFFPVLLKI